MNKLNRKRYFLKRFLRYFLVGVVAAIVPFAFFSMLFGLPAVLFGSIMLASNDVIAASKENHVTKTFTPLFWKVWVSSLLLAVLISAAYLYFGC